MLSLAVSLAWDELKLQKDAASLLARAEGLLEQGICCYLAASVSKRGPAAHAPSDDSLSPSDGSVLLLESEQRSRQYILRYAK
jgi:hypothetical protein